MTAFWLARATVVQPEAYARYAERVPHIVARYGGHILARGGDFLILEGEEDRHRFVVIAFPSMTAAQACFNSQEYREAAAFRRDGAGINSLVIVEGVPGGGGLLDGRESVLGFPRIPKKLFRKPFHGPLGVVRRLRDAGFRH